MSTKVTCSISGDAPKIVLASEMEAGDIGTIQGGSHAGELVMMDYKKENLIVLTEGNGDGWGESGFHHVKVIIHSEVEIVIKQ